MIVSVSGDGSVTAGLGSLKSCASVDWSLKILLAISTLALSKPSATLALKASLKASPASAFFPLDKSSINFFYMFTHYLTSLVNSPESGIAIIPSSISFLI